MPTIRDETHKKELIHRLRRVEGQLRGIQAMIEKGADCEAITQQLSASRRALDKAFYHVLSCAIQSGGETAAAEGEAKPAVDQRLAHAAELLARFG